MKYYTTIAVITKKWMSKKLKNANIFFVAFVSFVLGFLLGFYFIPIESFFQTYVPTLIQILITGIIGFLIGFAKSFRDAKQNAYGEIMPPIVKMSYEQNPTDDDMNEFNKALTKLWLYANKDVAFKVDTVARILAGHEGERSKAVQKAIIAMRKDIQYWRPFSKIDPEKVEHFYMRIGRRRD